MASLQTLHLAHLPASLAVHVALYRDLGNAAFLRQQLLDGNADFEYALIDASVVRAIRVQDEISYLEFKGIIYFFMLNSLNALLWDI